jgi:hypothetical protein
MAIRDWHYGKLILLWAIVVFCLYFLINSDAQGITIFFWCLILSIPVVIVTWKWLSGREKK